jgi:hypothetical protein
MRVLRLLCSDRRLQGLLTVIIVKQQRSLPGLES